MKRQEVHWIIGYAALLAFVTTLPYFFGYVAKGEGWYFTGFIVGVDDGNSYIAKMLRGAEGEWLFRTPYSSMEQRGVIAFLPYILLGKLASAPGLHEQLVALYHFFRVFITPLAVYATYQFISLFIKKVTWRRLATILATAGGGLGWILIILGKGEWFGSFPADWISPEWFGFLAFLISPHLILARTLILLGLTLYITSPIKKGQAWMAGMCFVLLGLVHPLGVATAIAVIGVHQCSIFIAALLRKAKPAFKKWFGIMLRAILPPLPLVLYYIIRFSTDPYLIIWTEQNRIFSPHPIHVIVAYGLVFIPALFGVGRILRFRRWSGLAIVAWVVAFPAFAYAPHNLQRRLPEGIWVAWTILAILGLKVLTEKYLKKTHLLSGIVLGLSLPTTLILVVSAIQYSFRLSLPIFRTSGEVEVFHWLDDHAEPGSVVLSSFSTGNAMPAWAPVSVVVGHGPETADIALLEPQVSDFYAAGMDDTEIHAFIQSQNISYVFLGPLERVPGGIDLEASTLFELRFESGDYQLFEVR